MTELPQGFAEAISKAEAFALDVRKEVEDVTQDPTLPFGFMVFTDSGYALDIEGVFDPCEDGEDEDENIYRTLYGVGWSMREKHYTPAAIVECAEVWRGAPDDDCPPRDNPIGEAYCIMVHRTEQKLLVHSRDLRRPASGGIVWDGDWRTDEVDQLGTRRMRALLKGWHEAQQVGAGANEPYPERLTA